MANRRARRIVIAVACATALALALVILVVTRRHGAEFDPLNGAESDPLIADFRGTERRCIQAFNDALHRQRANDIDELGLADTIDRSVLPPWRQIRARVDAVTDIPERKRALFRALKTYLADRQLAWEAYSAGLRAPSEEAARPLLDTYHQKNSQAVDDARVVAPLL